MLVPAAIVALVTSGCSAASSSDAVPTASTAAPGSTDDPCLLLSNDQIREATGWVLPDGEQLHVVDDEPRVTCSWHDMRAEAAVVVQVARSAGRAGFDEWTSQLSTASGAIATPADVDGVKLAVENPSYGMLTMLVGDDAVHVSVIGATARPDAPRVLAADLVQALA